MVEVNNGTGLSTVEVGGSDMGEVDSGAMAATEKVDRDARPVMAHVDGGARPAIAEVDGGDVAMAEPCGGDP